MHVHGNKYVVKPPTCQLEWLQSTAQPTLNAWLQQQVCVCVLQRGFSEAGVIMHMSVATFQKPLVMAAQSGGRRCFSRSQFACKGVPAKPWRRRWPQESGLPNTEEIELGIQRVETDSL